MASYTELRNLFSDDAFKNKVDIATVIAANNLLSGTPTTAQQVWAAKVFDSPRSESKKALMAVLAENSGLTTAQILGASDANIQTAVDGVVDALVAANAG